VLICSGVASSSLPGRLALGGGSVLLALLLIELVFRLFGLGGLPAPRRAVFDGVAHDWCCGPEIVDARGVHRFVPHTTFAHCYSGQRTDDFDAAGCVTYQLNDLGYRGGPIARPKASDVFRVVFLGDSFTFGEGTPDARIYPVVFERALTDRRVGGKRVEAVNLGMPGADTGSELTTYRQVARALEPDLVVLQWNTNDFPSSDMEAEHQRLIGAEYARDYEEARTRSWSRLLTFASSRIGMWRTSHELIAMANRVPLNPHAFDALAQVAQEIDRDGAGFAVLAFPELIRFDRYPYAAVIDALHDACQRHHITLIDLLPALSRYQDRDLWVHETDHHPNRIAHAVAAHALVDALKLPAR
jgi:hypothetical protein